MYTRLKYCMDAKLISVRFIIIIIIIIALPVSPH